MKKWMWIAALAACVTGLIGCRARERELVVMTHDSFDISAEVIAQFESLHQAQVTILKSGDAGEALNRAILSKNAPLADVFYGVDNTFLSRALDEDLFEAYRPQAIQKVSQELILDPDMRLVPVDWGDVCLNYDRAWFEGVELPPPASLDDLIRPEYAGLTVVQNPATSSPGLAFLLATIGQYGPEGYKAYWGALRENDVWVENGWSEAYYGQFSATSDGSRPIIVSYATSPAAEVYYGEVDTPPTAAVLAAGTCFRQVEFAGVLKGTEQRALARAFIDWVLDEPFQEDIPLHMWVYPANSEAELPDVFVQFADQAQDPASLPPADIAANRNTWIAEWTEIVLH